MQISVITICYNNLHGLRRTADSILAQTTPPVSWLVVDGGSVDGTRDYLAKLDVPYLSFISEPDDGLYDAMNKGLDRIGLEDADYVIFMNSGDAFADVETLRTLVEALQEDPVDLIYGDAIEFDGEARHYKAALGHQRVWYSMFTHHQAMAYSRSAIGPLRYDLSFKMAADWAFTAQLLKSGARARYLPTALCLFERGGFSQSPDKRALGRREHVRIHREVLHSPPMLGELSIFVKQGVNVVRSRFPRLYDFVRMRKG